MEGKKKRFSLIISHDSTDRWIPTLSQKGKSAWLTFNNRHMYVLWVEWLEAHGVLACKVLNQKLGGKSDKKLIGNQQTFLPPFIKESFINTLGTNRPPAWCFPLLLRLPFFQPTAQDKAKGAPLRCPLSGEVFPSLFQTGEPFSPLTPNAMQWGPALFPSVGKNLSRGQQRVALEYRSERGQL